MCECNMHYKKNNTAKLLSSKYIIYIWNTSFWRIKSQKASFKGWKKVHKGHVKHHFFSLAHCKDLCNFSNSAKLLSFKILPTMHVYSRYYCKHTCSGLHQGHHGCAFQTGDWNNYDIFRLCPVFEFNQICYWVLWLVIVSYWSYTEFIGCSLFYVFYVLFWNIPYSV